MYAWLIETFGEQNALFIAYGAGALGVLLLIWVLWFWTRRMSGGVFVHGGRGRKPRLAVVDAAAVDSHRRIVLVRRDDVEHLVMIGGHNDFVIERGIGADETASTEEQRAPPKPAPARVREKPRRAAAVAASREPAVAEKPADRKTPPPIAEARPAAAPGPAVEPKTAPEPKPAPEPAIQAERPQPPRSVAAPEPPQTELPGDYADTGDDEPPARRAVEPAPLQAAAVPPAYAEHVETEVPATKREPAFNIQPEPAADAAEEADDIKGGFEEQVRASIAEAEATVTGEGDDGSLEDEMQKLLAELTRKK